MATPFQKLPAEIRKMTANYSSAAEIVGGDVLSGTATATVTPSGLTVSAVSVDTVNNLATFLITSGTAGTNYTVSCLAATTGGALIAAQASVQATNSILN